MQAQETPFPVSKPSLPARVWEGIQFCAMMVFALIVVLIVLLVFRKEIAMMDKLRMDE